MEKTNEYALNIENFIERLSNIDIFGKDSIDKQNFDKEIRGFKKLIREIRSFIYKKNIIANYTFSQMEEFTKFKKTEEYYKICRLTCEKFQLCIDLINSTDFNFCVKFDDKEVDLPKDLNIHKDYEYSFLFFASIYWITIFFEAEGYIETINRNYNGLLELYCNVTNIILSDDKLNKDVIQTDTNLYLDLQNNGFNYKELNDLSCFYFFDILSNPKGDFKYLDNKGVFLVYKSIIYCLLENIKNHLYEIYNERYFLLTLKDSKQIVCCKGEKVDLTPTEYNIVKSIVDNKTPKYNRQTMHAINRKFKEVFKHNLFERKKKDKPYCIDDTHYFFVNNY